MYHYYYNQAEKNGDLHYISIDVWGVKCFPKSSWLFNVLIVQIWVNLKIKYGCPSIKIKGMTLAFYFYKCRNVLLFVNPDFALIAIKSFSILNNK